ncbi:Mrp/NBP35 family ATP-binding protein [Planctomycetales bacterium ZRK34]|nr:Mrp/NBP35 family ATP-binding protein [Planctomycetales bacterium ZRK34]
MAPTRDDITQQLRLVMHPRFGQDIVSLNRVQNIAECDGNVRLKIAAEPEARDKMRNDIMAALRKLGDDLKRIEIDFVGAEPTSAARPDPQQPSAQDQARESNPLPKVRHVVAVGAGKGGVGKSTVSVNLAVGLARRGLNVGLLDGDIYGPSAPTLLNLHDTEVTGTQQTLDPMSAHGIKVMTLGKLVDADKPLIWRGPMAHGAFRQLALQTDWGALDYLIIDLPPGTGDVPLTMAQMVPLSGAVIVCTPQRVAQDDAIRAASMFAQLDIDVLGVVENMSYFIGDDGKEYDIFGKGGAAKMAENLSLPLLGQIPINMALRANSDAGDPTANFDDKQLAAELDTLVTNLIEQVEAHETEAQGPSLNVH